MKHYSKEEFRRKVASFNNRLVEQIKESRIKQFELSLDSDSSFFEIGVQAGKAEAIETIQKDFAKEFGLERSPILDT